MATNGLNLNEKLERAVSLAQGAFEDAHKKSLDLKAYKKFLSSAVKLFTKGLMDKDVLTLFELEKTAEEFDLNRTSAIEKRTGSMSALESMKQNWEQMQNPVFVKKHFANAHSKLSEPLKSVKDTAMDTNIQSQCRKLGVLASGLATPAEKAFYLKRQECLKFIGKQHNLTINQHLGLSKGKELSR